MEAVAKIKSVPMSARKMRLVVDLIRNKDVEEALDILRFTNKEAATWLEKAVLSAIANWEDKLGGMESADDYELYIKTIFSDDGSMLKRFRPAPHGRAHRIRKRTNHLTVIVENRTPLPDDAGVESDDAVEVEELEDETAVEE
jgi:large subunit ribosomal protein L22